MQQIRERLKNKIDAIDDAKVKELETKKNETTSKQTAQNNEPRIDL